MRHAIVRTRRRTAVLLATPLAVLALCAGFAAVPTAQASPAAPNSVSDQTSTVCPDAGSTAFGPNVCVFNDTMSQAAIQADLNAIADEQVPVASQFDSQRYAIFFQPGTYGSASDPLVFQVGYYTEVAGLRIHAAGYGRRRRH